MFMVWETFGSGSGRFRFQPVPVPSGSGSAGSFSSPGSAGSVQKACVSFREFWNAQLGRCFLMFFLLFYGLGASRPVLKRTSALRWSKKWYSNVWAMKSDLDYALSKGRLQPWTGMNRNRYEPEPVWTGTGGTTTRTGTGGTGTGTDTNRTEPNRTVGFLILHRLMLENV